MKDLYRRHRPKKFADVIGQDQAVATLRGFLKKGNVPHCIGFYGQSGGGKTTLARILAKNIGCNPDKDEHDFQELNVSDFGGINMVRKIRSEVDRLPLAGKCKVYLLDECQGLTADAQAGLLKITEEVPDHVYFMMATTEPGKIKPTLRSRFTTIKLTPLNPIHLAEIITKVAAEEKADPPITMKVVRRIVDHSDCSARTALKFLESVLGASNEQERLALIMPLEAETDAFELVKLLMPFDNRKKPTWSELADLLEKIKNQDPEGIRRLVLKIATTNVLKGGQVAERAFLIIQTFRDNYFDCGRAGLVASCYECFGSK